MNQKGSKTFTENMGLTATQPKNSSWENRVPIETSTTQQSDISNMIHGTRLV
jgi:hypothetical protein